MSQKIRSKRPSLKQQKQQAAQPLAEITENAVVIPDVAELIATNNTNTNAEEAVVVANDVNVLPVSRQRVKPTKESILEHVELLLERVVNEVVASHENKSRPTPVRVFKSLEKDLKKLRSDCSRVLKGKTKKPSVAGANATGGFMKAVPISKALSKFTGWNPDELRSRVDVTKFICEYVKQHNLQNPEDRRQIIADKKLAKLLNYDIAKDGKPLTYFYLQNKLKPHFPAAAPTPAL
jgi:upstream activation factor subunit UAF30